MTGEHDEEREHEGRDIDLLLPWFATGKLRPEDETAIRAMLRDDTALRHNLALAEEERAAAIDANEAIGAPSRDLASRLLARIDAEPRARPQGASLWSRLGEGARSLFAVPRPWLAAAAVVVIAMQAGALVLLAARTSPTTYHTASGPEDTVAPGRLALIGFVPTASLSDMTSLLDRTGASIVEGPRGGLFTLRIGPATMTDADADRAVATLRASPIVMFASTKDR